MEITLSVLDKAGKVRARKTGTEAVSLFFREIYEAGDRITVETDSLGRFVTLAIDNALAPAIMLLKEGSFSFPVPFGDAKTIYAPTAFSGGNHRIAAHATGADALSGIRNLALNPADHGGNRAAYPHASASVETRGEAAFAARNAIDGEIASDDHGFWPYTSWGINCDPEATMTVDFGRKVIAQSVVLYTRADFPHDAWWTSARVTFSDGHSIDVPLEKTGAGQRFAFPERETEWVRLERLIKADDPSPFPALTQIEVWGRETPA
ncbi:carbohydrate-binding protein [Martelella lutilitoris]|uniref:Carbohydrate-binding protein n=1 Tax=Martelella lutilitoris TaxID=2583532 RepID=A0A5C4JTX1_9HYPH|nr:carbohydrate-binding protein [Martelella lutilitoris]TNB48680.1 carbohydrate-binding protein [Martelella lutilitoris]